MAGHMGARTVTNLGLKIALVDEDRNIIAVTGSVPGAINGIIRIELQKRTDAEVRPVLFGVLPLEEEVPEAAPEPETQELVEDVAVVEEATDDVAEESTEDAAEDSTEPEVDAEAEAEDKEENKEDEEKETTS